MIPSSYSLSPCCVFMIDTFVFTICGFVERYVFSIHHGTQLMHLQIRPPERQASRLENLIQARDGVFWACSSVCPLRLTRLACYSNVLAVPFHLVPCPWCFCGALLHGGNDIMFLWVTNKQACFLLQQFELGLLWSFPIHTRPVIKPMTSINMSLVEAWYKCSDMIWYLAEVNVKQGGLGPEIPVNRPTGSTLRFQGFQM